MPKVRVKKVIDGDTFETEQGRYIRLAGVNAPEKGEKEYAKAKQELKKLVEDETINYKPVGTSYGRIVADVIVDGKSVNKAMIRKGYK